MNILPCDYTASMVSSDQLAELTARLAPEIERVASSHADSPYACVHLCEDQDMLVRVQAVIAQKKALQPTALVVVGIGGSNLGTMAIAQALHGSFNNQQNKLKIYFADTVDADYINDIVQLVARELINNNKVIINIVSKSGATTETIANGELFIEQLKQHCGDNYHEYVVVTTDYDSALWQLGKQEGYTCLEIPRAVGGRYSVFSAVGLFPLGLMGIDIVNLLAGARAMRSTNYAVGNAATLYAHYKQGKAIHDTFLFSVNLEGIGKWYRQLMGESIGKEHNVHGNTVYVGITPTVSIGSTDLHSVGQLYLGGPRDKITTFITVGTTHAQTTVPEYPQFDALVSHIQGKQLSTIMKAIVQGTQRTYAQRSLPFISIVLPELSAFYLGQLIQLKMYEMIYLAYLLEVNPFDQPNVELYKQETRKILAHE